MQAALDLSDVETTGLLTAGARALESRSPNPLIDDPLAERIFDRLRPAYESSRVPLLRKMAEGKLKKPMRVHLSLRARRFDHYCSDFLTRHPGGSIVNLGCGLDTRFWRIDDGRVQFFDVDLPGMVAIKRELLDPHERYHLVASSVLDHEWMDEVATKSEGPCLFLAEGLLMYLPPEAVRELVVALNARFPGGELACEVFNAKWLRPPLRGIMNAKLQKQLQLGEGATFRSGVHDSREFEGYAEGIRFLDEWNFLDEHDEKVGFLRHFRDWEMFRHTQWVVHYAFRAADA